MNNEVVINRMIQELQEAKSKHGNPKAIRKHMENVQLLSSLFLEEETMEPSTSTSFSEKEKEVMFGDLYKNKPLEKQEKVVTDEGANGDSIFDF